MKGIHILICQKICTALAQGNVPHLRKELNYCHLHPQLVFELSTGALLYAFHRKEPYRLFFVGLLLAEAVIFQEKMDQQKKALEILLSAVQLEPSFDTPDLELVLQRLLKPIKISA